MKPDSSTLPDDGRRDQANRTAALHQKIAALMPAVEAILREDAAGLTELALIRRLQAPPWQLLESVDFSDPAGLYPVHFLLFHCLYRLRDDLAAMGEQLDISPLRVRIKAPDVVSGQGLPAEGDRLRLFYLDLSQYDLSEVAVRQMLDDFWSGRGPSQSNADELHKAARVLGFDDLPDDFHRIRQAYRRRAMQAHPDRGGTKEEVQSLNAAFHCLRDHFLSTVGAGRP